MDQGPFLWTNFFSLFHRFCDGVYVMGIDNQLQKLDSVLTEPFLIECGCIFVLLVDPLQSKECENLPQYWISSAS